jgi:peptidylprolyl isomerase
MATKLHQRIFAASGAILFFVTASALTVAVVVQAVQQNNSEKTATAQTQATQNNCSDNQTEATIATPEVYKPDGAVSDLQTTDLEAGSGDAAKSGDCLVVKYYGTLASNGNEFDQNFDKTTGFAFTLGQGQVIEGWDKGLVGMKQGGTRRLVIPAAQAYGSQSPSDKIPANSDLVFVVKLIRIQK